MRAVDICLLDLSSMLAFYVDVSKAAPWFVSFKSFYQGQCDIGWQKSFMYTMHVIRFTYRSFWKTVNIIQCDEGRDENFFLSEFARRQLHSIIIRM